MRRFFALAAVLALSACGDAPPPADKAPAEKAPAAAEKAPAPAEKKEVCTYSVAPEGSTVSWTAFKFTGKGGDEAWKAIDGVAFSIDTASVNTKNPDRDAKIKASFFGTMAETAAIKGTVKANSAGKATLSITMNGATHTTVVDVGNADGGLSLKGTIDVEQWGGGDAIAALNKVCEDLH